MSLKETDGNTETNKTTEPDFSDGRSRSMECPKQQKSLEKDYR